MKVLVSPKRGRGEAGSKQHFRRSVDKGHLDCCLFFLYIWFYQIDPKDGPYIFFRTFLLNFSD